ncbi:MAG: ABC transporter substrate-binding protein [Betaproteobacteria bacterium]|nr:ABC transporter substrate-binding protein [Betaproteobacteria bacterium]
MKLIRLLVLSAVASMVCGVANAQEKIIIGQSVPLSGSAADVGRDIRDGANAVFEKVNRGGGINGRKIELVSLDDGNDRKRAAANAQSLIDQKKALVLFGFGSATLSLDAIPLAEAKGMALFAPFTGSLSIRDKKPVFTVRASYRDEVDKIIAYWTTYGATRWAVVHYDDEVGKSNFNTVATALKAKNQTPLQIAVPRGSKVDQALYQPLLKFDPQAIIVTTQFPPLLELADFMNKQNKAYPMSALSFVNPDELASAKENIAKGTTVTQVVPNPKNVGIAVVKECTETMKATGTTVNYTTLEACIAAKALVEGIKKAGKNVTPQTIVSGLESLGSYDAGGFVLTFSKDNHHGSKWTDLSILSRGGAYRH